MTCCGSTDGAAAWRRVQVEGALLSIRLFTMFLKVPVILLAMIEGSLLVFAPYLSAAIMYQGHNFFSLAWHWRHWLPSGCTPPGSGWERRAFSFV